MTTNRKKIAKDAIVDIRNVKLHFWLVVILMEDIYNFIVTSQNVYCI